VTSLAKRARMTQLGHFTWSQFELDTFKSCKNAVSEKKLTKIMIVEADEGRKIIH